MLSEITEHRMYEKCPTQGTVFIKALLVAHLEEMLRLTRLTGHYTSQTRRRRGARLAEAAGQGPEGAPVGATRASRAGKG